MASCWWPWRWRRGCSWRPAARSPGPNSAGRAALYAPRAAAVAAAATVAVARAQMSYCSLMKSLTSAFRNMYGVSRFHHTTPVACCFSETLSGEKYTDPFKIGWRDLKGLYEDIRKELFISTAELREMSEYHFDGKGKAFRPIIVVLMARACNIHHNNARSPWSLVWASSFSTLFNIHGRATSAANKHFRKNFQSYIEFSHAEVKNASTYAYL